MENRNSSSLKYVVSDNDFFFKKFLLDGLMQNPFFTLVENTNNGHELLNRIFRKQVDVFIISLFMPILSGYETIKLIRESYKDTPIITYSSTYQDDFAELLNKFDNVYYCQKNSIVIKSFVNSQIFLKKDIYEDYLKEWQSTALSVKDYFSKQKQEAENLSIKDIQLLKFCYEGFSNKEIGESLSLSTRTIDTYIKRLSDKLGLKSKVDLVRYCVEKGFYNVDI